MKKDFHPRYVPCTITCACGKVVKTRATVPEMKVEICSNCHPFYTGKKKILDSTGRVERYKRLFDKSKNLQKNLSLKKKKKVKSKGQKVLKK